MNVLFVNMPFSSVRPAIGVSLLKAHLRQMGVSSTILYLNMRFARRLGDEDYQYIAEGSPLLACAGDWVFSRSAFGLRDAADADYLQAFTDRFGKFPSTSAGLGKLVRAREMADAFVEECFEQTDWGAFDVIGFTSSHAQNVASLALARRVKEAYPGLVIVFGGASCEAEMGVQLHQTFPFVDFVCGSEADVSFPQLIGALRAGEPGHGIPGVVARVEGRSHYATLAPQRVQHLDALPHPDYDDYYEQFAREFPAAKSSSPVVMESSRGCWWGEKHPCTFCGLNGTSMAFRSKSAGRVLEEMTALCERHGTRFVTMVDNILDMGYFDDLLPELERRKLQLGLFYETKANLTKAQVKALHAAGIHTIQPGIESFSTETLRIMRKGITAIENIQVLKWCKEMGITAQWNLLYGFPGEPPADYAATARIMDSIHHLTPPLGFDPIWLDRFQPNFTCAAELGISNVRADRSYGYIYGLTDAELFRLAYYFEHDYADGRDPETYVGEVHQALERWQREANSRGLLYADHGDHLAIWDFRPRAERTLTVLEGRERAIYLYCDQNRSLRQIQNILARSAAGDGGAAIEEFLDRLVQWRFMLHLDERYLSLAINVLGASAPLEKRTAGMAELVVV